MPSAFRISRFTLDSSERFCIVVESSTGLPAFYPTLYLTSQHRGRSEAFSTVQAAAASLVVLLGFLESRGIDLQERLLKRQYLKVHELDDLAAFVQTKIRPVKTGATVVRSIRGKATVPGRVSPGVVHARLTVIASYISWLARTLAGSLDGTAQRDLEAFERRIKARRPRMRQRATGRLMGIDLELAETILSRVEVGSLGNPFSAEVQHRNSLILRMLFMLGVRGGELLNIKVEDIDFQKKTVRIVRRPDDAGDTRVDQPSVKTLERLLSLSEELAGEIHRYIRTERKKVVGRGRHSYLFVTHREGPSKGDPLSLSAYFKIFSVLRQAFPDASRLSGHAFRHAWNERFSMILDSQESPPSEARQEQIRSYMMGWKEGSGTAASYNKRFIERKSHEASIVLQESMYAKPKG